MSLKKVLFVVIVVLFTLLGSTLEGVNIQYRVYTARVGWSPWAQDGSVAGDPGNLKRIEAVEIKLANQPAGMRVKYCVYSASTRTWLPCYFDGVIGGKPGRRMEGIRIYLIVPPKNMRVKYRVFIRNMGWTKWVYDGKSAGIIGQSKRLDALQVLLENR